MVKGYTNKIELNWIEFTKGMPLYSVQTRCVCPCDGLWSPLCEGLHHYHRTSLQSSLVQLVFVRRSNHRTVPSSPHDRNVYGSLGTVMICTEHSNGQRVSGFQAESERRRTPDLNNYDFLWSFIRRFVHGTQSGFFFWVHFIKEQGVFKHFSQGCL